MLQALISTVDISLPAHERELSSGTRVSRERGGDGVEQRDDGDDAPACAYEGSPMLVDNGSECFGRWGWMPIVSLKKI